MFTSCLPNWKTSTVAPVRSSSMRLESNLAHSASTLASSAFETNQLATHEAEGRRELVDRRRTSLLLSGKVAVGASVVVVGWTDLCGERSWSMCLVSFSTASRTKPIMTASEVCLFAARSSRTWPTCSSARCAMFRTRTLRHSGACVMPRNLQTAGEVVALTMSVSAATPLTRKSILSPSCSLKRPFARSCRTRMASARPTMPLRPPHVITQRSGKLMGWPTKFSKGLRIRNMTKRRTIIKVYMRTVHK
mmetsp:Transcript_118364/g.346735  ORF Transcript_118364/g.346735 Transcript_118364/m.346735 type:complete len:249 (+) Transcript_118364:1233-1979(+)